MTQTPKISDSDLERLQDHVRLLHGLKKRADAPRHKTVTSRRHKLVALFPKATEPTTTMSPRRAAVAAAAGVNLGTDATPRTKDTELAALRPRLNKTYLFRRQCVQKRINSQRESDGSDLREAQRIHDHNLQPIRHDYFQLNKAFHMRWKNIRGLPVVHSHFRKTYLDTGKPPFVVPVHYKPFNVYWDADYAKQEFIFLDAVSDEKKKDEKKKTITKQEPPTEPSTETPRRGSSLRQDSLLEQQPPLGEQPPLGQQPPRKSSSLLRQERRDRESTGYEGFPRDSVIEAAQAQSEKKYL